MPHFRRVAAVLALLTASAGQLSGQIDQAKATDRGCRTGIGLQSVQPHWVAASAAPSEEYVPAYGVVRRSHASADDFPPDHETHDWNIVVKLDDAYKGLYSSAAEKLNGEPVMEYEWEMRSFPREFWPIVGDRIWTFGRWIFDCGHQPYLTEFHPPLAIALTRLEPTIFSGDVAPSLATRTYLYARRGAGYMDVPSAVASRNYEFDIALPAPPSASAAMRAEVLALPYGGPQPQLTLFPNERRVHVLYPLSAFGDAPSDRQMGAVIAAGWREATSSVGYREMRITLQSIKINQDHVSNVPGIGDSNGAQWQMWTQLGPQWLEVLRTNKAPGLPAVNPENGKVDNNPTVALSGSVSYFIPDDGAVVLRSTGWESDRQDDHFGISVPNPADLNALFDPNDKLGVLDVAYGAAQNYGVGNRHEKSKKNYVEGSDDDTNEDFELSFKVEEVRRFPPGTAVVSGAANSDQVCVATEEPFLAQLGANVFVIGANSRVSMVFTASPLTPAENPAPTRVLLFKRPGDDRKVKITADDATVRSCHYDATQLDAAYVFVEFQVAGTPYRVTGTETWDPNGAWRELFYRYRGLDVRVHEVFVYKPKGETPSKAPEI
jgi:hypothetical protein